MSFELMQGQKIWKAWYTDEATYKGWETVSKGDAAYANDQGWCIFYEVQDYGGQARLSVNCRDIRAWFADFDDSTKEEQLERIRMSPLRPSYVVESGNGYHVYFVAKTEDAVVGRVERFKGIQGSMAQYFGSDNKVSDPARLIRAPGYLHWKDRQNPFIVSVVFKSGVTYTESQIMAAFVPKESPEVEEVKKELAIAFSGEGSIAQKVYNMNHMDALKRISGSKYVNGERYTFKQNHNGKYNILVNGKGCHCFIDANGRIGAKNQGGATVTHWINYFVKDWKRSVEIMREVFPELWTINS